jgi:ketosteroid isomerase-like protein
MSQKSTTPDLVERLDRLADAINAQDDDAVVSFYGHDVVWDSHGPIAGRRRLGE